MGPAGELTANMLPVEALGDLDLSNLRGVMTDIDDTLTTRGELTAQAYAALERLRDAGIRVIPVTGRPAGWCDHIARMWPVAAVVGENGAFWFRHDAARGRLERTYIFDDERRRRDRRRLDEIREEVLAAVPGAGIASDQDYRVSDLAIDFCEDVPALGTEAVDRIVAIARSHGATAKISSIHVNIWFGEFDKLATARRMCRELYGEDDDDLRSSYVFVGDSPNDAPMFSFFPMSVGVANVLDFAGRLEAQPRYVTRRACGAGFAELADLVVARRKGERR